MSSFKHSGNVLFLLPYPVGHAPSQRFRVESLLPLLDAAEIRYTLRPFMTEATWKVLYKGGSLPRKAAGIFGGYCRRLWTVFAEARNYDQIFIHREAAPLGPPVFEWLLKFVLRKKIIYDFDDAIWIPNTSAQNRLAAHLKAFWKVGSICRWSAVVAGGNDYLCDYARRNDAKQVVKIPTVVNTNTRYNRLKHYEHQKPLVVGWTGSHSTLKYLDAVMPALAALQEQLNFTFLVIADQKPELQLKNWTFLPWNPATEIDDLLQIDIGIMPLTSDAWSQGKCGFKLIQYMALGIPALASPIGVNTAIIDDGVNGFLYENAEGFVQKLMELLTHPERCQSMGISAREKIVVRYSVAAIQPAFLKLFSA